jgi:hypothetical protein
VEFKYQGYSGRKFLATSKGNAVIVNMSDSDMAIAREFGSALTGFTLLSEKKLLAHVSETDGSGTRVDTALEYQFDRSTDSIRLLGKSPFCTEKADCAFLQTGAEIRIKTCNYFGAMKEMGPCIFPPPKVELRPDLFADQDTIWAVEAEHFYSKE